MAKKRSCRRTADEYKIHEEISSIKGIGDATICKIADHFRKAGNQNE